MDTITRAAKILYRPFLIAVLISSVSGAAEAALILPLTLGAVVLIPPLICNMRRGCQAK